MCCCTPVQFWIHIFIYIYIFFLLRITCNMYHVLYVLYCEPHIVIGPIQCSFLQGPCDNPGVAPSWQIYSETILPLHSTYKQMFEVNKFVEIFSSINGLRYTCKALLQTRAVPGVVRKSYSCASPCTRSQGWMSLYARGCSTYTVVIN